LKLSSADECILDLLDNCDRIIKDEYFEEDSDVEEIETLELHYPDKEKRL
jgi:hypothetical protein